MSHKCSWIFIFEFPWITPFGVGLAHCFDINVFVFFRQKCPSMSHKCSWIFIFECPWITPSGVGLAHCFDINVFVFFRQKCSSMSHKCSWIIIFELPWITPFGVGLAREAMFRHKCPSDLSIKYYNLLSEQLFVFLVKNVH